MLLYRYGLYSYCIYSYVLLTNLCPYLLYNYGLYSYCIYSYCIYSYVLLTNFCPYTTCMSEQIPTVHVCTRVHAHVCTHGYMRECTSLSTAPCLPTFLHTCLFIFQTPGLWLSHSTFGCTLYTHVRTGISYGPLLNYAAARAVVSATYITWATIYNRGNYIQYRQLYILLPTIYNIGNDT